MYRFAHVRHFQRQCDALLKKYPRLVSDIHQALNDFRKESAQALGARLYKVRIRSSDAGKGKSGGFRAIVLLIEVERVLVPVAVYAKSARENLSEKELEYHLSMVVFELREIGFSIR